MFLSNKLKHMKTYQSDYHHFIVSEKGSTDYLTDRKEKAMFLSEKLTIYKYSNSPFVGAELKFNIQDDKHNQYLTDRFELYSQNQRYSFNHFQGCTIHSNQIGSILYSINDKKTSIAYIVQQLDQTNNMWRRINDKRLALLSILKSKKDL